MSSLYVHSVFSVKNRNPFLKDAEIRRETHAFPGGVANKLECPPIIVGGMKNHIHLLCRLSRIISQADYVKEQKRVSTIYYETTAQILGRRVDKRSASTIFSSRWMRFAYPPYAGTFFICWGDETLNMIVEWRIKHDD